MSRISSFCSGGDCVEVGLNVEGQVRVRSTENLSRYALFSPQEWAAFVLGVKAGEFDPDELQ